jgi:telomerase protein component 1
VFISSTFRDMHSERETLVKTVFPLLRSKLAPYHIDVHEIDMRWGVTEAQANDNQTLSLCLEQVLDCNYFVGLLGDRYGYTPPAYPPVRSSELAWLGQYPEGASVTELEVECQLRKQVFRC